MVQPRGEHPVAAELPPVLVRDDVVRVVRARAVEAKATDEAAGELAARDDAVEPAAARVAGAVAPVDRCEGAGHRVARAGA